MGCLPHRIFKDSMDTTIAFMSARQMIKNVCGTANRSRFHHLVCPLRHTHHSPETKFDVVGAGIIVGLSVGTVLLMRLLLAN
jgi:hypothetical protein